MTGEATPSAWIGDLRGTIMANIFAEFTKEPEDGTSVVLRVNVNGQAVVLGGEVVAGSVISADLVEVPPGRSEQNPATAKVVFSLFTQERIQGRWEMPDGNAGTLSLVPAPLVAQPSSSEVASSAAPIQVVQSTRQLPKITIYRDEIKDLIASMKAWLPSTFDVIVRVEVDGQEVRRFAPHFWDFPNLPTKTNRLNLWLSEPGDIARSININLAPTDCSYTVSGPDDVWVAGTFHQVERVLGRKHTWWRAMYEKHALNLNAIAMLLAIAFAPSLDLPGRVILLGSTVVLAIIIKQFHDRTTALKIYLRADYKETPYLDMPRLATALASAALIAFVTWAYALLNGGALRDLLVWLTARS